MTKDIRPKVIGGTAKGRVLAVPASTRPLTGRIKQSIFDTLSEFIPGSEVLDLFAGSGSMGIEALSRGAQSATFVEADGEAQALLAENIAHVGFAPSSTIEHTSVEHFLKHCQGEFDLIFLDPPFKDAETFPLHPVWKAMKKGAILVFRKPRKANPTIPNGLTLEHSDVLGVSEVLYLRKEISQSLAFCPDSAYTF